LLTFTLPSTNRIVSSSFPSFPQQLERDDMAAAALSLNANKDVEVLQEFSGV
jgi:hypothetical protein